MIDTLHRLDQDLTLAINSLHFTGGDYFWQLMSWKESWYPLYALVLVMLFRRLGWKKALIVLASLILTVVACDQMANLVKDNVARLRPCYDSRMLAGGLYVLERRASYYGFFSGHAANAFGFAMCSVMGFRNDRTTRYRGYSWFIYIWASLIGISRIFAGKHYLGDVLVGTLMGLLIGFVMGWLARRAIKALECESSCQA